jgi:hypothetical protein
MKAGIRAAAEREGIEMVACQTSTEGYSSNREWFRRGDLRSPASAAIASRQPFELRGESPGFRLDVCRYLCWGKDKA